MLILTRRSQERLRIGENVVITVLGIKRNQVRIGIDAPRHLTVDREEIYNRKRSTYPITDRSADNGTNGRAVR